MRNRAQILRAATAAFSTTGLSASVNDIARDASVGVGTLYRHFPTKEQLLAEVVRESLAELLEVARAVAERAGEDPGARLLAWMHAVGEHISRFTAVREWVGAALTGDPELRVLHQEVLAAAAALLDGAQVAGRAAPGTDIADLMAAIAALTGTSPEDPDRLRRLVGLLATGVLREP